MTTRLLTLVLALLAAVVSACAPYGVQPAPVSKTSQVRVGVQWTVIAVEGVVPMTEPMPTMVWTSATQIRGSGGCNRFSGAVLVEDDYLRIGPLAPTGKPCVTAPTGQEDMFFRALELTRKVRQTDGQLVLMDEAGKTLARMVESN